MLLILLIISVNANLKSESILGENGCKNPDKVSTITCGRKSYEIISCNTSYCDLPYEMRGIKCVDDTFVVTENLDKAISVNFCRKPEKGYVKLDKDTAAYIEINLCYENPTFFNTKTIIFKTSSNNQNIVYYYDFSGPSCTSKNSYGPYTLDYINSNIPPTSKYTSLYGYKNCDFNSGLDIVGTVYFNTSEELTINKCKINENNYYEKIYCGLKYVESDGKCLKPCLNKIDHCIDCDDNDFSKCSECESNYMVSNGECVLKCDINCKTCDGPNQCSECYSNYKPKDGICIYCNKNKCLSCSNENYCESCSNGYHPENGECVEDEIVYDCDVDNCLSCSDNNYCKTCKTNYHTSYGKCEPDCNIDNCGSCSSPNYCSDCSYGFHTNGKGGCDITCDDPNCEYCTSRYYCEKCKDPYITSLGECTSPDPQQSSGNNPQPTNNCGENCIECSDAGLCNRCADGYYTKYDYNNYKDCHKCSDEVSHCNNCGAYGENDAYLDCFDCEEGYLPVDKEDNGMLGKYCKKCDIDNCKQYYSNGKYIYCEKCKDGYDTNEDKTICIKHQSSSSYYNPDNGSLSLMILLVAILLLII